jgi:hypothetical protein
MSLITATAVTQYSNITLSVQSILDGKYIQAVQNKIMMITNNTFTLDLYVQGSMTFSATNRTVIASGTKFSDNNFLAGDMIYIYNSYRNDSYYEVASVSDYTLTLASGESVVDELSGQSILISVARWPLDVQRVAAQMIQYDADVRPTQTANVRSHSLGPFSETFTAGDEDQFGYPRRITDQLIPYRMARVG